MAIIFAVVAYFSWAIGIFFEAIAARRINSYSLTFWGLVIGAILSTFYLPFAFHLAQGFTLGLFLLNLFLALFFIGGTIIYYEALKMENRSLTGTIASAFPVFTVILSIFLLGERVDLIHSLAIIITFIGLMLCILDFREISGGKKIISKGIVFALIASVSWGIYFAFVKLLVVEVGWFWPNYIVFLFFPLMFLFMKMRKIELKLPTVNNVFWPLIISVVLVRIAEYSYNFAITKGQVTVVASIAGANPTLFVVLAFLFLKDPIRKQQILGIVITLAGIVFLSFIG
jgi:drug/metabolite transporter (DMT)-like permease